MIFFQFRLKACVRITGSAGPPSQRVPNPMKSNPVIAFENTQWRKVKSDGPPTQQEK